MSDRTVWQRTFFGGFRELWKRLHWWNFANIHQSWKLVALLVFVASSHTADSRNGESSANLSLVKHLTSPVYSFRDYPSLVNAAYKRHQLILLRRSPLEPVISSLLSHLITLHSFPIPDNARLRMKLHCHWKCFFTITNDKSTAWIRKRSSCCTVVSFVHFDSLFHLPRPG